MSISPLIFSCCQQPERKVLEDLNMRMWSELLGICFVETKNLDGETNLKQKQVPKDISVDFDDIRKISNAKNKFTYEKPNDFLYKFVGKY